MLISKHAQQECSESTKFSAATVPFSILWDTLCDGPTNCSANVNNMPTWITKIVSHYLG